MYSESIMFYFFFQAEDGIRDADVTGVQTCALPIFDHVPFVRPLHQLVDLRGHGTLDDLEQRPGIDLVVAQRSEERRVGKECRSRGLPYHYKKIKCEYCSRNSPSIEMTEHIQPHLLE